MISYTVSITILLILLLLLVILFPTNKCLEQFDSGGLYIITRTGKREKCFLNLKRSLEEQSEKGFYHLKTNDDPHNTFLINEKNVINVTPINKKEKMHCPYNSYINTAIHEVNGWALIIDDDSKFVNKDFLKKLNILCHKMDPEIVIIFRIYYGKEKKILPPDENKIEENKFDMANICIHSSILKKYKFTEECKADIKLIKQLQKDKVPLHFEKSLPIGIWANYSGKMDGYNNDCE